MSCEQFPSMDTPIARDIFLHPAFGPGWQVYREQSGSPVPSAVARYAERFAEHAPCGTAGLTERSMLLHGDIRADNMFFAGDRLKVVDFQFAARGVGAADIGYLVSQGLPTEVRRGHDEDLVREYLERLAAAGCYRLLVRRRMAPLPVRGRLSGGASGDHADRLGCDAGALTCAMPDAHRSGRGDHRRDWRIGGIRMTRTAREVVELYNTRLWNERDFDLADELIADTMIRHEVGESQTLTREQARNASSNTLGACSTNCAST